MRFLSGFVFCSAFFAGSMLQASSLAAPCKTDTLADYELLKGGPQCSIGIENFDGFTFGIPSGTATMFETASDILVTPMANSGDIGGNFEFTRKDGSPFAVASGQTAQYTMRWEFLIDPGPVGAGADLGMDPPFGNVTILQQYCVDSALLVSGSNVSCSIGQPLQSLSVDVPHPTAHLNFSPEAMFYGQVRTVITLDGTGLPSGSGFDGVSSGQQVTPEPASIALAFGGLLALCARRKFRSAS